MSTPQLRPAQSKNAPGEHSILLSLLRRSLSTLLILGCAGLSSISAYAFTQIATATTLTASPTTGAAGSPMTFTVTVSAAGTPITTGGQVAICNDVDEGCSLAEAWIVLQLSPSGTASVNLIGVGSHTVVQAGFAGTKTYAPSDSAAFASFSWVDLNVPTTTTFSSTGSAGNYTLLATLGYHSYADAPNQQPTAAMQFIDTSNSNHVIGTGTGVFASPSTQDMLVSGASLTAGTQPSHVATGDFNGDGRTDIAVVNTGDNTVSIFLCNGDGTFQTPVTYATGTAPNAIITGDFNADGKVDLAILNNTDRTVSILRGTGTGTFLAQTTYPTGINPIALATGDLDEDGVADLVVLNHDDQTIGILLGNGDATFKAQVTYATGNDPRAIAVGDTDVDGHVDVLVANFADNNLSMLLGVGDGTVVTSTPQTTGNGPIAVALVDLDDSGYTSLMWLNYSDNTMTILSREFGSTAYVTTTYTTGPGPVAFIFEDVNHDRTFDPAVLNSDGTLGVYPASGNFDGLYGLTPINYSVPVGASSLAYGDFNSDGTADIVTAGGTTAPPALLLQQFTAYTYYRLIGASVPGSSSSNVVATYAGDTGYHISTSAPLSLTDSPIATITTLVLSPSTGVSTGQSDTLTATIAPVVVGNYNATGSITFLDNGTAVCSAVALSGSTATCNTGPLPIAQHVYTAVYSGDPYFATSTSIAHILNVANSTTTTLSLSSTTAAQGTPIVATVSVAQTDNSSALNGMVNLCESTAAACTGAALLGSVQLQSVHGATPGSATLKLYLTKGSHSIKAVYAGTALDLTSSSSPIAVTISAPAKTVSMVTTTSSGSAGSYTITVSVAGVGTTNAPSGTVSFKDALDTGYPSPTAKALSGTTAGGYTFEPAVVYPQNVYTQADGNYLISIHDMKVADLRHNGIKDILYPSNDTGALAVRLGNGDGTFGTQVQYPVTTADYSSLDSLAVGDFNGDGIPDVVIGDDGGNFGTHVMNGTLYILLGNGDGTFPPTPSAVIPVDNIYIPNVSVGPMSLAIGDFNLDGIQDIAVGTQEGTVYILLGNGDGTFQTPAVYGGTSGYYVTNLTVADMNNDGFPDLVSTQVFGDEVTVLLGHGDGTFGSAINSDNAGDGGGTGNAIAVADLNGDGIQDVVTGYSDSEIAVQFGKGDGTFQDGTLYSTGGKDPSGLAIGDVTGDGIQDIVTTFFLSSAAVVYPGSSSTPGTFGSRTAFGSGGANGPIFIADLNGDGAQDVIVEDGEDNQVDVLIGHTATITSKATFSAVSIPGSTSKSAHSLVATGYTGDTNHLAPVSNPGLGIAGTLIPTTVTLGVNASPSAYGTNAVTATVSTTVVSGYTTHANVKFTDGATTVANVAVNGATALTNGIPTTAVYNPSIGVHSFKGTFAGDSNFKVSSASSALADTVNGSQLTPVITWTPPTLINVGNTLTTVLTATANTAGTFTYTATLSGGSPVAVTSSTLLIAGSYTVTVSFAPTDTTDYITPAPVDKALTVSGENIWLINSVGSLSGLQNSGAAFTPTAASGGGGGIAVDSAGDIWSGNTAGTTLTEFSKTGAVLNGSVSGGGLNAPAALAIDGNGVIWVANGNNSVSAFSGAGTAISPSTGYTGGSINAPTGIAIDTSGNVWISNSGNNSETEILGGAAPVTPLASAAQNGTLGVKP